MMKKMKQVAMLREVKKLLKQPPQKPEGTIRPENSLTHELMKATIIYYLKKGRYPVEGILQRVAEMKQHFEFVEHVLQEKLQFFDVSKATGKYPITVYAEAEIGKDRVDVLAVTHEEKVAIEIDYKHKTEKEKIERLKEKGLKVKVVQ